MYFCVPYSEYEPWASNRTNRNGPPTFSGYGIYKSVNGGATWSFAHSGIPSNASIYRLAMDPSNSQILYAALNETHDGVVGGLYKTNNGGSTWTALNVPGGIRSVNDVVVNKNTGNVYIACGNNNSDGSQGGGFVSLNGGEAWTKIFDMPFVKELEASSVNPNIMIANVGHDRQIGGINAGCYVTIDDGENWHKINKQFGQPDRVRKLRTDPHDESTLWAAIFGTGFAKLDISPLLEDDFLLGDVNLDGLVTFSDISPFISLLISGGYQDEADCDQDGIVSFADIETFIEILIAA
jgi:hypothetical protein